VEEKEGILLLDWKPVWKPQPVKLYQINEDQVLIVIGNESGVYNTETRTITSPPSELPKPKRLLFRSRAKCLLLPYGGPLESPETWINFELWQRGFGFKTLGVYFRKKDLKASVLKVARRANDLNCGDFEDYVRGRIAFDHGRLGEATKILILALKNDDPEIRSIACWALYELDGLLDVKNWIRRLKNLLRKEKDPEVRAEAKEALKEFQKELKKDSNRIS